MIPFPLSLLLLPAAALAGVAYVGLARTPSPAARALGRTALLAATWTSPLATRGPGPAQLTIGLLMGFLGIRMVALAERWRTAPPAPPPGRVLAAMVIPEELLAPAPPTPGGPWPTVLRGLMAAAACVVLLILGDAARLWRWSRGLDDLLVFVEVAAGAAGIHRLIVGVARLTARSVAGLQDQPILSASLSQFWGRRWNRLVQGNLSWAFFRRHGRGRRAARGTLTAFAASGVMHAVAVLDADRPAVTLAPAAAVMAFFLIHAALVQGERRLGWNRQPTEPRALFWARARTVAVFIVLSPLLLDPFARVVHVHGRGLTASGRW